MGRCYLLRDYLFARCGFVHGVASNGSEDGCSQLRAESAEVNVTGGRERAVAGLWESECCRVRVGQPGQRRGCARGPRGSERGRRCGCDGERGDDTMAAVDKRAMKSGWTAASGGGADKRCRPRNRSTQFQLCRVYMQQFMVSSGQERDPQ